MRWQEKIVNARAFPFVLGQRVAYSVQGLQELHAPASDRGTVIGASWDKRCVRVKFDRLNAPLTIAKRFVTKADA